MCIDCTRAILSNRLGKGQLVLEAATAAVQKTGKAGLEAIMSSKMSEKSGFLAQVFINIFVAREHQSFFCKFFVVLFCCFVFNAL